MHTPHRCIVIALLLSFFFFTGCSKTSVIGTWKKSDYTAQPFTSILVVALTKDPGNQFLWENIMATSLRQHGTKEVTTTLNVFPHYKENEVLDKQKIIDYVNNNNIEGILVTRLVDTKQEKIYHPPPNRNYRGSYGYYRSFDSYYSHAQSYSRSYTTQTIVLLETNLYQVKNQELIWSLSSDTIESGSIPKLIDSASKKVLEILKKDQLI